MDTTVQSPWVSGQFCLTGAATVQISVVAYKHPLGLPARFYAGLIPAIELSRRLESRGVKAVVRIVDPSPIAYHFNGWAVELSTQLQDLIADFLSGNKVGFFFDRSEEVGSEALDVLRPLGLKLLSSADPDVMRIVRKLRGSGERHGGKTGADNAHLYMAAHPFSWLDMHHPSIWKRSYPSEGTQFVNLMSRAEESFAAVRRFLRGSRPDLCTGNSPVDLYTTICRTPCYIPLDGEPLLEDVKNQGCGRCLERYRELGGTNGNHPQGARRDFEALMSFLKP